MDKAIRSPPKPPSRSEHLLIVDDEKDTADVMKMALERAGFNVDVFYHPTTALQEFIAGKYDLVLLDVKMPVMDGFALFDHMRVLDPDLKVCFMTARSDNDEVFRRHLQDNRRVSVARKPVRVHDLVLLLRAELDAKKTGRQTPFRLE